MTSPLDRPEDRLFEDFSRLNNELVTSRRQLAQANADLTELAGELERRVGERTRRLQESNEELRTLAYAMAHDLRAPARHIDALAGLLEGACASTLPARELEWLRLAREAASRQCVLIDHILDYMRFGSAPMSIERVDMEAEFARAISRVPADGGAGRVQWVIGKVPAAQADRSLAREIIRQLIDNAVKFVSRSAAPAITIGAIDLPGEVAYFVRDNGVGVDPAHASLLFRPFRQLHSPAEFPGVGMGLALVRRLAMRHDGRAWVEPEAGAGATFYFTLGEKHA